MEELGNKEKTIQEGNASGKISAIAGMLAVNKYNLYKGKNINYQLEKQANEIEIQAKISGIIGEIETKIPGLTLPNDISALIADHMLQAINSGITDVSQLGKDNSFGTEVFEKTVLSKMDPQEIVRCVKQNQEDGIYSEYTVGRVYEICDKNAIEGKDGNSFIFIEMSEELEGIINFKIPKEGKSIINEHGEEVMVEIDCKDGSSIIVTQSDDPEQQISQESAIDMEIVQNKEINIRDLRIECNDNKELLETSINKYKNIIDSDSGNYAALEVAYQNMHSYGIDAVVSSQNTFEAQSFNILVDKMLDDRMSGKSQTEDSYTKGLKLGIISAIYNSTILNTSDPTVQDTKMKLKKAEPELYSLIEKDSQVFKKMQTLAQNDYHEQATLAVTGNANGIPGNDFFEKVQEFLDRNKDLQVDEQYTCKEVAQEIEEPIAESKPPKKELSEEEIIEKKTRSLLHAAEKKGVGYAISTVFPGITGNEPNQGAAIVSNVFNTETRGQEGNLLDSIQTEEDLEGIKKAITKFIESYQSKERDFTTEKTIAILQETLTNESKRVKGKPMLSTDSINIGEILKKTSEKNGLIGNNKNEGLDDLEI